MAKPHKKANRLHQQLLGTLIETKPVSYTKKTLGKDKDGKEVVLNTQVTHDVLRFPLAQNISEQSVERAAQRWA